MIYCEKLKTIETIQDGPLKLTRGVISVNNEILKIKKNWSLWTTRPLKKTFTFYLFWCNVVIFQFSEFHHEILRLLSPKFWDLRMCVNSRF